VRPAEPGSGWKSGSFWKLDGREVSQFFVLGGWAGVISRWTEPYFLVVPFAQRQIFEFFIFKFLQF
jgi:hypothetical protein